MSKANSLSNMRLLDDLADKKTSIHKVHPVAKLLTTVIYMAVVVSFGKYDFSGIIAFIFYPVLIFAFGELPIVPILKRLLIVEPVIIGIGILNPLFEKQTMLIGHFAISQGWITFLSIMLKSTLTVLAGLVLIATTGMDKLALALRVLRVPKIFILQLLLTYRYIYILIEEVFRMQRAYFLRAPGHKGIHRNVWGSFGGNLILRTFERGQRVYQGMSLRGFNGEYNTQKTLKFRFADFAYLLVWSLFFIAARVYNIPMLIGLFFTGVIK